MSYLTQAVLWIAGMAVAGLAVRPLVNRLDRSKR